MSLIIKIPSINLDEKNNKFYEGDWDNEKDLAIVIENKILKIRTLQDCMMIDFENKTINKKSYDYYIKRIKNSQEITKDLFLKKLIEKSKIKYLMKI